MFGEWVGDEADKEVMFFLVSYVELFDFLKYVFNNFVELFDYICACIVLVKVWKIKNIVFLWMIKYFWLFLNEFLGG